MLGPRPTDWQTTAIALYGSLREEILVMTKCNVVLTYNIWTIYIWVQILVLPCYTCMQPGIQLFFLLLVNFMYNCYLL